MVRHDLPTELFCHRIVNRIGRRPATIKIRGAEAPIGVRVYITCSQWIFSQIQNGGLVSPNLKVKFYRELVHFSVYGDTMEHFPPGFFEWGEKDIVEWLSERLAIHEFGGG